MFPWIRSPAEPPPARYNIAPSQPIAVVPNDGKNQVQFFHWGLIPSWAKDPSIGNRLINAREETLIAKPAFRNALKRRRCLVPASGFYEWKKNPDGRTKTATYIRMKDTRPFAFAGLWEIWHSSDGSEIRSCTLITGEPNELVRPIHNRMPVILDEATYQAWLAPGEAEPEEMLKLLAVFPAERMETFSVSNLVNSPANELPECIEPIASDSLFG